MAWIRACGEYKPYYTPAYAVQAGVIETGYTFSGSHTYNSGGYQQMTGGVECRSNAIDVRGYSHIDVTFLAGATGGTTVTIDGVSQSSTVGWGVETFTYDVSNATNVVIVWQRSNTSMESRLYDVYMY